MLTSRLVDKLIRLEVHSNLISKKLQGRHLIAKFFIYDPKKSVKTEESEVVVEGVRSSQGDSVNLVTGAGELYCQGPFSSGDVGKDGEGLPISKQNAAVVEVVAAEEYVHWVGSSTPVRANAGFESQGFTLAKTVSHVFG